MCGPALTCGELALGTVYRPHPLYDHQYSIPTVLERGESYLFAINSYEVQVSSTVEALGTRRGGAAQWRVGRDARDPATYYVVQL